MLTAKAKVLCLMGPTATGKTQLAMALVDHWRCDLISVDSAMVYRGLDIGAAKPSAACLQAYPHQLIDIRDPWQSYSAAEFSADALAAIHVSHQASRIPVLVGGTMLYYKALLQGMADLPSADPILRAELLAQAKLKGWHHLHTMLKGVDLPSAQRIHPNDPQRLQRALEVYILTGKSLSAHWAEQTRTERSWEPLCVALTMARDSLRERIAVRFKAMLAQGFEAEVAGLMAQAKIHRQLPAMKSVGYQQVWRYLCGEIDRETMIEQAIVASCQLAKRQQTWLRAWPHLHCFEAGSETVLTKILALGHQHGLQ
jgi:tRNA dimethylallyltransferase